MDEQTFPSVFAVFEHLQSQGWAGLYHTPPNFTEMQFSEDVQIACPMPMQPLYRGQNAIYSPCKPSLFRGNWTKEQSFERLIQLSDFKAILQEHPEIKDMEQNGLVVNYEGLAQHYGIPTNMMDMTNSPLVAAFFATTRYDALSDTYSPILNRISKGIIYFSPIGDMANFSDHNRIWPIGLEALHRPGEQRAFAMVMDEDSDFDMLHFTFWHDPDSSLRVWHETDGGKIFFPFDPMAEKVRIMKKYRTYSLESLRDVYESNTDFATSFEDARKLMEDSGCTFLNHLPFAYTKDEIQYLINEYHKKYPDSLQ